MLCNYLCLYTHLAAQLEGLQVWLMTAWQHTGDIGAMQLTMNVFPCELRTYFDQTGGDDDSFISFMYGLNEACFTVFSADVYTVIRLL